MNMKEFAALKVGDKVDNLMLGTSTGEIVVVEDEGVRVVWGPRNPLETRFFYHVNSTAWKHWGKVPNDDTARSAAATD